MNTKTKYTHSFKRLNYQSFCTGWTAVLLVIVLIFPFVSPFHSRIYIAMPEGENGHWQPRNGSMTTVYVEKTGSISLDDQRVEDLEKLPIMIEERGEERKDGEMYKVLLKADGRVRYGIVRNILDKLAKSNVKVVGLVTHEKASVWDLTPKKKKGTR